MSIVTVEILHLHSSLTIRCSHLFNGSGNELARMRLWKPLPHVYILFGVPCTVHRKLHAGTVYSLCVNKNCTPAATITHRAVPGSITSHCRGEPVQFSPVYSCYRFWRQTGVLLFAPAAAFVFWFNSCSAELNIPYTSSLLCNGQARGDI